VSPSVYVVRRTIAGGDVRWQVRFRLGGRESRPRSAGTFGTRREADTRARWVAGEIAAMRVPDLRRLEARAPEKLAEAFDRWMAERPPRTTAQRKQRTQARAKLGRVGQVDLERLHYSDVQTWLEQLIDDGLAASTVTHYLAPVRQAVDHAELGRPNPARDRRLDLPLDEEEEMEPPSYRNFRILIEELTPRHRPVAIIMERTGLRTREVRAFPWGDVDFAGGRIRVARGRTKRGTGGQRWVPLLEEARTVLEARAAPEDRLPNALVFADFADSSFRQAITRACKRAGLPHYTPHELRHRFLSLLLLAGIDIVLVRRIAGHKKASITLDVYGHVLLDEPEERLAALRRGVAVVSGLSERAPERKEFPAQTPLPTKWRIPDSNR
jgi:integrase